MNIVIVEDERLAAVKLQNMIKRYDPAFEVVGILDSVEGSIDWLDRNKQPDLLFLDIQLTDGTCFDIIKQVELSCPVIFTTAYDQYALEAFNLQSIAYLIKPISQEKLNTAMEKLMKMRESLSLPKIDLKTLLKAIGRSQQAYKSRFLVKKGSSLQSVNTTDIAYFYSEAKLVFLCTKTNNRYVLNETLDELETLLDPSKFFRINRQYIVNFDVIRKVHPHFKGRLKIELDPSPTEAIYISNRRATPFKEWLNC